MDVAEQLKDDLRDGRIDPEQLVDLIVSLQRQLQASMQRNAELEKQLAGTTTAKVDEPFVAVHSLLELAFPRSSGFDY